MAVHQLMGSVVVRVGALTPLRGRKPMYNFGLLQKLNY